MWKIDKIITAYVILYTLANEYNKFFYRFIIREEVCLEEGNCSPDDTSNFCIYWRDTVCKNNTFLFIYFICQNWVCFRLLVYIWKYKKIHIVTAEVIETAIDTDDEDSGIETDI